MSESRIPCILDESAKVEVGGGSGVDLKRAGYRDPDGTYERLGVAAVLWTATEADSRNAWHRDNGVELRAVEPLLALRTAAVRDARPAGFRSCCWRRSTATRSGTPSFSFTRN